MTRRILLTFITATSLVSLSSSAYSAAVVQISGSSINAKAATAGTAVGKRDMGRLLTASRLDLSATSLSLAIQDGGKFLTLTGLNAVNPIAQAIPVMQYQYAGLDDPAIALTTSVAGSNSDSAPAPAASEKVGSASSFAAVPEPSSIALLAMGSVAFLRRRRS